jgi:hypothetical protein
MLSTMADMTAGEDSVDPRPGIYLIDVDTGQVSHLVSRNTFPRERRAHPEHLSFELITQQKKHNHEAIPHRGASARW